MRPKAPRKLRKHHTAGELRAVVDETIGLFHRLRWVAEQIYPEDGRSTARRGLLRGLLRYGPQTVPALAKARSISRQSVQAVVDELMAEGFVTSRPNPSHRRSRLICITDEGVALVRKMDRTDERVLAAVGAGLDPKELAITLGMLRELRRRFERTPLWRRALPGGPAAH